MLKSLSITTVVPMILVSLNDKYMLVPSMVLSTLSVCFLTTFMPQFATLWMQLAVLRPLER